MKIEEQNVDPALVAIIQVVRAKYGIEAPDFQKNQVRELSRRRLSAGL